MKPIKKSSFIRIILVLVLAFVVYLGLNLRNRYFLKQNNWGKKSSEIKASGDDEDLAQDYQSETEAYDYKIVKSKGSIENKDIGFAKGHYPPGHTPAEAWQTLIASWEDKVRDPGLGVYTEITKLAYRDFSNLPDAQYSENVRIFKNKSYQVLQDDRYAVIYFGNKKGWQNAPYLFCRTKAGWQLDIVHQRKYVRMGPKPHWGIERADYPYIDLLAPCPFWMKQDIPLGDNDIYRIEDDIRLAGRMRQAERNYAARPDDFETAIELGRLYTVTSLRPQKRISILVNAKKLNPESSLPYKYLGISQLDAFYNFKAAITEMESYVAMEPRDEFGHKYLGYLYLCEKRYRDAIDEFQKALELSPDNIYARTKISRAYAGLFLSALKKGPANMDYKTQAIEMYQNAAVRAHQDSRRLRWLQDFLKKSGILE